MLNIPFLNLDFGVKFTVPFKSLGSVRFFFYGFQVFICLIKYTEKNSNIMKYHCNLKDLFSI